TCALPIFGIGFVFQPQDAGALVVVPHPALEGNESAAGRIGEPALQGQGIDGAVGEPEHSQPPDTGGTNTTRSPWRKGTFQGENASFTTRWMRSSGMGKP